MTSSHPTNNRRDSWMMRNRILMTSLTGVILTLCVIQLICDVDLPLGILGEWVWNRSLATPSITILLTFFASVCTIGVVSSFCIHRYQTGFNSETNNQTSVESESNKHTNSRSLLYISILFVCMPIYHWFLLDSCTIYFGMERWSASLYSKHSSGYLTEAKQIDSLSEFLGDYETWIESKGNFHIGTHPPGLIVSNLLLLDFYKARPDLSKRMARLQPERFRNGYRFASESSVPLPEQATVFTIAVLTYLCCMFTGLFVYLCANLVFHPRIGLLAAVAWWTLPNWILFLPVSDCLFPLITISVVYFGCRAYCSNSLIANAIMSSIASCILLVGLTFSLANLVIVPMIGFTVLFDLFRQYSNDVKRPIQKIGAMLAAGFGCMIFLIIGFYLATGCNLIDVWRINLEKHAGFYETKTLTYSKWILVNVLEYSIVCGPALMCGLCCVLGSRKAFNNWKLALPWGWALTMLILNLSGKNLSEFARLWILTTPIVCVIAAVFFANSPVEQSHISEKRPGRIQLLFNRYACIFLLIASQILLTIVLLTHVEPLMWDNMKERLESTSQGDDNTDPNKSMIENGR